MKQTQKHRLNSGIGLYKVGQQKPKTESLTVTLFNCTNVVATVSVGSTTNVWTFVVLPTHAVWAGVAQNWATTFAQLKRMTVNEPLVG